MNQDISDPIEDYYSQNVRKISYPTREGAMQAVADGKADAAYVFYYMAQEYVIATNPDFSIIRLWKSRLSLAG